MSSVICPECDVAIRKECIHTHIYKEHPHFIYTDTFSSNIMLKKFLRAIEGEPIPYDIGFSETDAKGEAKDMFMDMASGAYVKEATAQTHINNHPEKHIGRWIECVAESLKEPKNMMALVSRLISKPERVIMDEFLINKKDTEIAELMTEVKRLKQTNFELDSKLLKANEPIEKRLAELRAHQSVIDKVEINRLNAEIRGLQDKIDELREINKSYSTAEYKAFLDADTLLDREKKKWSKEIEKTEKKVEAKYEKKVKDLKSHIKKLEYELLVGGSDSETDSKRYSKKKASGGAGRSSRSSGSDSD
jgi:predicted  nucleic acid-binding Zn-ribbon protein